MMEIYAETEFSCPIYDNNNSSFLEPFVGCISGGSVHKLKGPVCLTHDIRILLNDQHGWEASATEVRVDEGYTYFKIPPYTAAWHDEDDTRLVHIKFYGCDACKRKKAIKFLYKRLDGPLGLMWE